MALHGKDSDTCRLIEFEPHDEDILRRSASSTSMIDSMDGSPGFTNVSTDRFVTAVRESGNQRLKLIAWRRSANGAYERIGDSGTDFSKIHDTPEVIWLGGGRLAVLFKGVSTGRLKVVSVHVDRSGKFSRKADAETSGPVTSAGSACLVEPYISTSAHPFLIDRDRFVIATVFRTREGRLSFDCWEIDHTPSKVMRRGGLVDRAIEGRAAIACLPGQRRAVVAAFDTQSGRMRITGYNVSNPARPRRIFDSGEAGVLMTHTPDISALGNPEGNQFVTAIRMAEGGRLRVQCWDIDNNTNLIRAADNGPGAGPRIDASPSIARARAGRSSRFHTVATRQERLTTGHWLWL